MTYDEWPRRGYCVASSIRHAIDTMETDWGWPQVKAVGPYPVFKAPDGTLVYPLSDCMKLQGLRDVDIYLGYQYYYARNAFFLEQYTSRFTFKYPDGTLYNLKRP